MVSILTVREKGGLFYLYFEWVGQVLTWSSFCSLVGCLFATLLSNRYGLLRPLLVTLLAMSVIVGMLANGITDKTILISVFSFNRLWIFIDVYQMSTIANVHKLGRYAVLMPGAQGLGQIIGPNLAASILGLNFGYSGVFIMCAGAAVLAMLLYSFIYVRFKENIRLGLCYLGKGPCGRVCLLCELY
jgi:MFS family permease